MVLRQQEPSALRMVLPSATLAVKAISWAGTSARKINAFAQMAQVQQALIAAGTGHNSAPLATKVSRSQEVHVWRTCATALVVQLQLEQIVLRRAQANALHAILV